MMQIALVSPSDKVQCLPIGHPLCGKVFVPEGYDSPEFVSLEIGMKKKLTLEWMPVDLIGWVKSLEVEILESYENVVN